MAGAKGYEAHTFFELRRSGAHIFFSPLQLHRNGAPCKLSSDETPCGDNSEDSVGDQRTSESDSASNHSYPEADECMYIIASCGSTESSSVPESSSDEGDQITTSERPGRGLFSVGEVQTRRGRSVRPPAHFSDFLSLNMVLRDFI